MSDIQLNLKNKCENVYKIDINDKIHLLIFDA